MSKKNDDLLQQMRDRFAKIRDDSAEQDNRRQAIEDLAFRNGEQWPEDLKAQRERDGRPCLVLNKLPGFIDQVVGDQRQNRPSIKVRPVDSKSDPEIAKILEGLIRSIEVQSKADIAYDSSFEQAVSCGYGAFRVLTQYADDDVFEQDVLIKPILNPFTVYFDPDAKEWDRSDGRYCFVTEWIDKDVFESRYGKKFEKTDFDSDMGEQEWVEGDKIRVAEYWMKEEETRKLLQLRTMEGDIYTVWADDEAKIGPRPEGIEVVKEREVKTHRVKCYTVSGTDILDEKEWAGKYIPIVPVWGKELNINGRRYVRGLIRFAKDAQRLYNYARSAQIEAVALQPKAPIMATPEQIEGHEYQWDTMGTANFPYLLVNPDPRMPGYPQRMNPPQMSSGHTEQVQISSDEMKSTTGIYDASLGARGNETSGRAILARQKEGDVATFAFIDNLSRSLTYCGKILVDLIPKIYDTERVIRVRGIDGQEQTVEINKAMVEKDQQTGQPVPVLFNDITAGKYDVAVTVGPSFTTQRLETADILMQMTQANPNLWTVIGDLIVKNLDFIDSEEMVNRLKKIMPPGLAEDSQAAQGQPEQGPQEQAMQQQQAQQQAQQQQMQQQVQQQAQQKMQMETMKDQISIAQEKARLDGIEMDNKKKALEIDKMVAELSGSSPERTRTMPERLPMG